ncbi:MAG: GTP 3',8-cyclase MoaA [Candidatus Krumholzibacteriota bacterium]
MSVGKARNPLVDPQGRKLNYLRVAVTDRCNLRCRYCMPAEGVKQVSHDDILTLEETLRICSLFAEMGVAKIRVTGGEPLVRKGVVPFIHSLAQLPTRPEVLLTTNGLVLEEHLAKLKAAGVRRINMSLDSLNAETWTEITRRKGFAKVRSAVDRVLEMGLGLKINVVVLPGLNDHEISDFVELTRKNPLAVRFIEPMPFDGAGKALEDTIDGHEILVRLRGKYELKPVLQQADAVDKLFNVSGFKGTVGIIEGHSRTFCATCSRLRLDSRGRLRTCLYGAPGVNLLEMVRAGRSDDELAAAIRTEISYRFKDGKKAELAHHLVGLESMASIGG